MEAQWNAYFFCKSILKLTLCSISPPRTTPRQDICATVTLQRGLHHCQFQVLCHASSFQICKREAYIGCVVRTSWSSHCVIDRKPESSLRYLASPRLYFQFILNSSSVTAVKFCTPNSVYSSLPVLQVPVLCSHNSQILQTEVKTENKP